MQKIAATFFPKSRDPLSPIAPCHAPQIDWYNPMTDRF